jgi:hypothetical protein
MLGFLLLAVANGVQAHEESNDVPPTRAQEYVQIWLGSTGADDSWSVDDGAGTTLSGDYSSLPLGGGVGQRMWGDRAQYGFEGGGLVSWQNDDIDFAGGDPGLVVAVETDLIMVELFMGGVVAVRPTRWLRLYAAGGPSIAWGHLSGNDDDDEDVGPDDTTIIVTGPGTFIVIDRDENSSDISLSGYARAGLEIEVGSGFTFGASVRYAEHEFDFDSRGELKLDDVQWFLTLGGRF